ncbi:contact-dependent growth inhibition system immunity protein [Cellulomonas xylanilytica]|nr:contact-dependent growth inhibition system immunity protein [Cellulomonas xylanilytica]
MGRNHGKSRPRREDPIHYLASTYFHQDYDLEAREPLGVVRNFVGAADEETISALRRETVHLLADTEDEEVLVLRWSKASYDPRDDGISMREWFESVVSVLDGRR